MSYGIEQAPEPRKIFLGFLITALMEIEATLYHGSNISRTPALMLGLIDSLDETAKEKLKSQHEKLATMRLHPYMKGNTKEAYEQLYREITTYLHQTWLKELQAKPRFGETSQSLGKREDHARTG